MKKIGIIGGGFSGTMLATHLIRNSLNPVEIILIDKKELFSKGIAYSSFSDQHLLNVSAGKMSAFPNEPDHFLDWVMSNTEFQKENRQLVAGFYLSRKIYGQYLSHVWKKSLKEAALKKIKVSVINAHVNRLEAKKNTIIIHSDEMLPVEADYGIIATGNHPPRNPQIPNMGFYDSPDYFRNPWNADSVKNINEEFPVLILGNGLTMVDVVLGILEQGYKGKIISLSPNGFNILSHKHSYVKYDKLSEELEGQKSLFEWFKLIHKHIKNVRQYGLSAEPVIDSLRPYTQTIWKSLSDREKEIFMSRLRHLWGVARHRLPLNSFDKIQKLRIEGKLEINSGKLINLTEEKEFISTEYFDKKTKETRNLKVSRIINCTGPETDLMKLENNFLKRCLMDGILYQDKLKLGIKANTETFQVLKPDGKAQAHLFTLGTNLKGELWESTAVSELRVQAEKLAERLIVVCQNKKREPWLVK